MTRKVSIKDIAQAAGVSTTAVSLVLNNKEKNGRISNEVSAKIKEIAEEKNYRLNTIAQSLRTGKTKILGLIVADISNPFFARLARHIENLAAEKGYQVMFGSSDESKTKFHKLVNLFVDKNVDGIIVAPPQDSEDVIMELVKRRVPSVLVDRGFEGLPVSSVQLDNAGASYILTTHLLKQGCRRIGLMAYNLGLPNIKKRYEGYVKALEKYGIPLDEKIVRSVVFENFEENVKKALDDLLANDIDSIVFATNRIGVQSLILLQQYNKCNELKYVSIDNPEEYQISNISITCIEQPINSIGERALNILFRQIDDPRYNEVEYVVLRAKIFQ